MRSRARRPLPRPSNTELARILLRVADRLEDQDASASRVGAFRAAAQTVAELDAEVAELLARGGRAALVALPAIDESIAAALEESARTGGLELLERLEGRLDPISLFATIPGVGSQLARKVHITLNVDTFEELDGAVHDGRLARVPGFGSRRIAAVREHLAARLRRCRRAREAIGDPPLALVLDVDAEYRRRVAAATLPRIAPHRFNPTHERWLPVLHTERDNWAFTAMYSNTAQAHRLGRTADWVVLFYQKGAHTGQCTVVTERHGPLKGRRCARGREAELAALVEQKAPALPAGSEKSPGAASWLAVREDQHRRKEP
jgi:hypothetical protein